MLRPFKRIIFTIPTLTSLASKTTYPLTSLLFCSHHGSVENGWTRLKFGRYTHFSLEIMGRKETTRPTTGFTSFTPCSPKGLGFFHRLDHLGYPDNDRRRLAMVVKHEPSICLSPTCKRHPTRIWNPSLFPGVRLESC